MLGGCNHGERFTNIVATKRVLTCNVPDGEREIKREREREGERERGRERERERERETRDGDVP